MAARWLAQSQRRGKGQRREFGVELLATSDWRMRQTKHEVTPLPPCRASKVRFLDLLMDLHRVIRLGEGPRLLLKGCDNQHIII